jgi:hypothetical protein
MRTTISYREIETFKASWSCHGFPEELNGIEAEWENESGDLTDFRAWDENGRAIPEGWDGPALCALLDDAKARVEAKLWFALGFYERDRVYGGPEEGGWWYDTEALVRPWKFVRGRDKAERLCARANRTLRHRERSLRYGTGSVCYAGGAYEARCNVGSALQPHYPTHRPQYE